ncbi:MAG: hypothetical protein JW940_37390 [Polyangiaceae bacterium]|nr:hypothetical protein [Polyangiaceae bacterium]
MRRFMLAAVVLAFVSVPSLTFAEGAPQRDSVRASSEQAGLGRSALPLLKRRAGPGNESRLQAWQDGLDGFAHLSGKAQQRAGDDWISIASDTGWFLSVAARGDHFDYLNDALANASVWDEAPPTPLDALISQAADVAEGPVAGLLGYSPREKLVPFQVSREMLGLRGNDGKLLAETVAVNILEYIRLIDGVPVLGRGSRVRIGVSPQGELVSVDVTWSRLDVVKGSQREVVSVGALLERQAQLAAAHGIPATATRTKFECGYLDNGQSSVVQPGCQAAFKYENNGATVVSEVWVPAMRTPVSDATWPELARMRQGGPDDG